MKKINKKQVRNSQNNINHNMNKNYRNYNKIMNS